MRIVLLVRPGYRYEDVTIRATFGGLAKAYGRLGHEVDVFCWRKAADSLPLCEARPWGRVWHLRSVRDLFSSPGGATPAAVLRRSDLAQLLISGFHAGALLYRSGLFLWLLLRVRLRGVPVAVNIWDMPPKSEGALGRMLDASILRYVLGNSFWITALSSVVRDSVVRDAADLASLIHIVPNGFDPEEVERARSRHRSSAREGQGKSYVVCGSRLAHYKGIDVLLMAWSAVAPEAPGLELRIAGPDQCEGYFQRLAERLGLSGRVRFLGELDRAAVMDEMCGSLFFVLPSRTESFGMAALEAMACGKPVVATRTGTADYIEDGLSGLLVAPRNPGALAEAMLRLIRDSGLREKLGRTARQKIEADYSWEAVARKYLSVDAGARRDSAV
ncbi:MAG: glycosyltransferase family 4 protein [Elusimicrobiota bacterium]